MGWGSARARTSVRSVAAVALPVVLGVGLVVGAARTTGGDGTDRASLVTAVPVQPAAAGPWRGDGTGVDLALADGALDQPSGLEALATPAPPRAWPAAGGLTGTFGERRSRHVHAGLDLDGEVGDPVVAADAGVVVHAGGAPKGYGGYGTVVMIDHGGGVQTLSAHLSRVDVVVGQAVRPGDLVGAIGVSGSVTGSHLHYEVRRDGVALDPATWLPPR